MSRPTPEQHRSTCRRRRWILGVASGIWLIRAGSIGRATADEPASTAEEPDRLDVIRRRASEAGLSGLRLEEGERYVALGSARDDFIRGALRLCEGLADDFLDHFNGLGFDLSAPADRMAMVALASSDEFGRFLGVDHAPEVTGVFEVGQNYLVLYDGRSGGPAGPRAERANTMTLFHEATHQLTFNTGLLDPGGDVPLAIAEGLGMYGEVRRPDGRTKVGAVNQERLAVIGQELRQGRPLIPLAELLDDATFEREETVQLAYAQSWLFVFGLMRNDRALGRFRGYLGALRGPGGDPTRRVELAREHLGALEELDDGLKAFGARLLRGR